MAAAEEQLLGCLRDRFLTTAPDSRAKLSLICSTSAAKSTQFLLLDSFSFDFWIRFLLNFVAKPCLCLCMFFSTIGWRSVSSWSCGILLDCIVPSRQSSLWSVLMLLKVFGHQGHYHRNCHRKSSRSVASVNATS